MTVLLAILSLATYAGLIETTLPSQCLANFRWDDCGSPPQTVIYYWRVASRCEVGIWRGCVPNMNMFKDEYECVSTCTFAVRASDQDFHQLNGNEEDAVPEPNYGDYQIFTEPFNSTDDMTTTPEEDITTEPPVAGDEKKDEKDGDKGPGEAVKLIDDNQEHAPDEMKDGDQAATEGADPEHKPEENPEEETEAKPEEEAEAAAEAEAE
ncbi:hypothetical protein PYW07_001345 [Mythimna separata]|uniref:BPTI/Kunitz inhibitor domain-containing protein n=1 Tax=Mythimna separata TaxID=271217 RepID=A0AAD7YSA4_MYTSE|nr:hypothetical protein PYW07_001345 [Mythimna separata]